MKDNSFEILVIQNGFCDPEPAYTDLTIQEAFSKIKELKCKLEKNGYSCEFIKNCFPNLMLDCMCGNKKYTFKIDFGRCVYLEYNKLFYDFFGDDIKPTQEIFG